MGFTQFELQRQMKLRLHQEPQRLALKMFPGFSSQYVYKNLVKKELLNYCIYFEAILIYVRPILKWSPCIMKVDLLLNKSYEENIPSINTDMI